MTQVRAQVAEIRLLGLPLADLDSKAAAAQIAERPADATFGYVVTPNADHFARLHADPTLVAIYRAAWLRLLDSRVVAAAARLLGLPTPSVSPGSDVTAALLQEHLQPRERITIIGMEAAEVAALTRRFQLTPPAHHNPPIGFEHDPAAFAAAVAFALSHPARLVFLAVGSPRQELLAAAIAATGRARGTGLCIGASLAFLAGTKRRAPRWLQRAGLEWLYRLLADPRRLFVRYLRRSPLALWMLLRERFPSSK